jgi:hypothetical protein
MRLKIIRVSLKHNATFGVFLRNDGVPFAVTLERPWMFNKPSVGDVPGSCIPAGTYLCKRVNSPKFGDTFEVTGVTGRSAILFHKGNINDDTRGCILVGEQFEPVKGKDGIVASAKGFEEFKTLTAGLNEFELEIVEY